MTRPMVTDAMAEEWGEETPPNAGRVIGRLLRDRDRTLGLLELAMSISQEWNSARYGGFLDEARKLLKEARDA